MEYIDVFVYFSRFFPNLIHLRASLMEHEVVVSLAERISQSGSVKRQSFQDLELTQISFTLNALTRTETLRKTEKFLGKHKTWPSFRKNVNQAHPSI